MLTDHKKLAKTSGRPGKTQLINHFLINKSWFLVDLPGYGYAQVSKKAKNTFQKFITDYFTDRKQLVCAFVLIDLRHEPQKIDMEFMQWLGENGVPFGMIFTKADKVKPNALTRNITEYSEAMLETWEELPPIFVTSSANNFGSEEVLEYIAQINLSL